MWRSQKVYVCVFFLLLNDAFNPLSELFTTAKIPFLVMKVEKVLTICSVLRQVWTSTELHVCCRIERLPMCIMTRDAASKYALLQCMDDKSC